jgi:hypothetical protein
VGVIVDGQGVEDAEVLLRQPPGQHDVPHPIQIDVQGIAEIRHPAMAVVDLEELQLRIGTMSSARTAHRKFGWFRCGSIGWWCAWLCSWTAWMFSRIVSATVGPVRGSISSTMFAALT